MGETPLTITDAAAALRAGELTSVELVEAGYAVADRLDPLLGTFIARYDETARAAAARADAELAAGLDRGPLHGIPLGIKDIIACQEGPTKANSLVNDPEWWAGRDAPVVGRLRAAGAVVTGKLGTSEYACGMPDATKPFPTPRNPWNTDHWPGGSSSGSGSGVASGMFLGALGTDTGGSIRLPAAYCGISGLKATYGLVPKAGCLPLGVTYDHIGPMARSAADCAAMLAVMAGYAAGDPSMPTGASAEGYPAQLTGDLKGVTVGVERAHHLGKAGSDPALETVFEAAVAVLTEAGATVVEVELPLYDELFAATMYGFMIEAFAFHRPWLQERWTDYGRHTRGVLGTGALFNAADYAQFQKVRRIAAAGVGELFDTVDLIVSPTEGTGSPIVDGLDWGDAIAQCFTPYWNGVGHPALSVPMGFNSIDLPLGLQIAGRPFEDGLVMRAGDAFQRFTDFHLQVPALAARPCLTARPCPTARPCLTAEAAALRPPTSTGANRGECPSRCPPDHHRCRCRPAGRRADQRGADRGRLRRGRPCRPRHRHLPHPLRRDGPRRSRGRRCGVRGGGGPGPLHGIPLGIKDIIACSEGPTTGNSVVNDPAWFAGRDAPVVARLRQAGGIMMGKLSTCEYACGLPDETKPFPVPGNAWDPETWPGGSSSGSGSGVSSGMFLGALGTDTGGSVRMPASFCGISGLKQTYGLVPKSGCLPLGVTLDHIGPMARSAADCALMLDVMAGFDPSDPSMSPAGSSYGTAGDYTAGLLGDLHGVTVGVERANHLDKPANDPALAGAFEAAVAALTEAGATIVEVEIPYYQEVVAATMLGWPVEAFAFHRPWMQERWTDYGRSARSGLGGGALLSAADYAQLLKVRRIGKAALDQLFTTVDLIVSPTTAGGAIRLDELAWDNLMDALYTPYWNGVGCPALSVPMGFTAGGLPLGLQIGGRPMQDGLVLRAGDAYQRLTDHHLQLPPLAVAVDA